MMQIQLINPYNKQELFREGEMLVDQEGNQFPYINGAYRFVKDDNYTENFGFEWNHFQKTQIDRDSKVSQSQERFFAETSWDKLDLEGKNILEVGSGAGRFSQVVLDYTKANLYSIDYSNAVEANFKNNGHHDRLHLFQASIYDLPFAKNSFDKVFCFGVLQHTPDFKKSVQSLVEMVREGGELVVDFYPIRGWWTKINAKYLFRPFTKKLSHDKLLILIQKHVGWMIVVSQFFNKICIGKMTNRFIPICNISLLPSNLSKEALREWVTLDTFDMFSPEYDNPQKLQTVKKWFDEFGMKQVSAEFISYGDGNQVAVVKGIK